MSLLRRKSAGVLPLEVCVPRIVCMLATLALVLVGLVMVYSASSITELVNGQPAAKSLISQAVYAVFGIACALAIFRFVPYHLWSGNLTWAIWGVSVLLILLTAVAGKSVYGAQRWLEIGPVAIQPSEFFKIAAVLMAAKLLYQARNGEADNRTLLVEALLFIIAPLMFLYATQSDLGTTLVCAVGILAVMWLGEIPTRIFAPLIGCCFGFGILAVVFSGYRSGRMVFLNPWNDGANGLDAGYNIIHSFYAFAEGGLLGVGLGNSHEKYQYLFASDSDFIFSIIGEELGLIGALLVIAGYLAILWAGLQIARKADDGMGAMLAGGLSIMLVAQAFLNMGSAIGVFPTTGKPLPFISSGGSSMIASLLMMGIILSVSYAEGSQQVYEKRRASLHILRADAPAPSAERRSRAPYPSGLREQAHRGQAPSRGYAYGGWASYGRQTSGGPSYGRQPYGRQAPNRGQAPSRGQAPYRGQSAYRVEAYRSEPAFQVGVRPYRGRGRL